MRGGPTTDVWLGRGQGGLRSTGRLPKQHRSQQRGRCDPQAKAIHHPEEWGLGGTRAFPWQAPTAGA